MTPAFARAAATPALPRRFVAVCATLGFHTPFLFPERAGRDYAPTPYLDVLKDHRADLTVFSGLSHPDQGGATGHSSEMTWLTAARRPGPRRVQEHRLPRPTDRRAGRPPHPLPVARADDRQRLAVVVGQRRPGPRRGVAGPSCSSNSS